MTLEQLRIFVAVATREHVTRGAQDLHLTQSATSAAIAALETRHNVKLFDRVGRRIVLTDAGRLFLIEAKAVLARAFDAETALSDLGGLKRGRLQLSASQTIANYWLPQVIHGFTSQFPGIEVNLHIGNTDTVVADVRSGNVDIGMIEGEVDDANLTVAHVANDELVLVVPPDHPFQDGLTDPSDLLRTARFVMREPGSGTRSIFEASLAKFGLNVGDLTIALVLPSNEAIRSAVEAGAGVAVMSKLVVAQALQAGSLRRIELDIPTRRFYLLGHRDRYVSRAAREFKAKIGVTYPATHASELNV